MTVGELREELAGLNPDLPVLVYVAMSEDMDEAHGVCIQDTTKPDELLYCKGDHPLDQRYGWCPGITQALCIR